MRPSEAEQLRRLVLEAARDVLPACGLKVRGPGSERPCECEPREVLAFMAVTGDALRGTIALAVPLELLYAAYPLPLPDGGGAEPLALDWAGEIVNRLLGRIKHALALRGVAIQASTPRVSLGDPLRASRETASTVCAVAFPSAGACVRVWFHACSAERLSLPVPALGFDALSEGDVLLFD